MTIEDEVLAYFRLMDDETQEEALGMFRSLAKSFPRSQKLQLVHSIGANVVSLHPHDDGPQSLLTFRGK